MIYSGFFISLKSYLVVIVLFIAWFFYKKVLEEEKTLEKDFGTDYLKHKTKVHRFI
jgi:protein-S-isoprenylcysteine O-methyltransferase Ste14